MALKLQNKETKEMESAKNQVEILVKSRVCDRQKILSASHNIDKLRRKVDKWNSVEEIRRWRGPI